MLREIVKTKQHPGEPKRRWFYSHEQDLYVWHNESGEIISFQLCYAKHRNERALYWKAGAGYSHLRVDDGESSAFSNDSPILIADGVFDGAEVLNRFHVLAATLPPDIVEFVAARIQECPIANPIEREDG